MYNQLIMLQLAVLGSTRGTDMQAIIDAIEQKRLDATISLVVSNKSDAYIVQRAINYNIPHMIIDYTLYSTREEAEQVIVNALQSAGVSLILLVGWMKILTPFFTNSFKGRIWNIHPSLLPKYSGGMNLDVHRAVISNNETESGCTLHEVSEKVDGGKILMQKSCSIVPLETAETLRDKVQKLEQECFVEALQNVVKGIWSIGP